MYIDLLPIVAHSLHAVATKGAEVEAQPECQDGAAGAVEEG